MILMIIISSISGIIWYLPLFKQLSTRYFNYFLSLTLSGTFCLLFLYIFKIPTNYIYPACYLYMLSSLVEKKKAYYLLGLAVLLAVLCPTLKLGNGWLFGISAIISFVIFLIVLQEMVVLFIERYELNLFLILLFIYLSIDMVKLFDVAINLNLGIIYYYFGLVSQMFLGIAFWFININTKSFKVRIKALEDM